MFVLHGEPQGHILSPAGDVVGGRQSPATVTLAEGLMSTRLLASSLLLSLACCLAQAQTYPAAPVATAQEQAALGNNIQRCMTLMTTSTAQHRNTVKVLVYGQSISKQEWSQQVAAWLRSTYPNVDFIIKNPSIGGCASQCLVAPAHHDLYPFYPDLVIFHVYGANDSYDSIVRSTRQFTTAEMLLQTDHYTGADSWSDQMSYTFIPGFCRTYHCGLADIRHPWQRYLTANSYQPVDLTLDGTHLNAQGCWLMAELIERNLRRNTSQASDPDGLVKEYHPGTDANWSAGKLTMRFAGNRVDLVLDNAGPAGGRAAVRVDGQAPSSYPELYTFTRPNGQYGSDWIVTNPDSGVDWPWKTGAIMYVRSNTKLLVEDWTVTITRWVSGTDFSFSLAGSRTGADGSGSYASNPFVSTSGRVVIDQSAWWLSSINDTTISVGHTIKWSVTPNFVDTAVVPVMSDAAKEYTVTLAQGLSNADHTLELSMLGSGTSLPIKAIRVYRPFYGRAATTVPDPQAVGVDLPLAICRAPGDVTMAGARVYDLSGRMLAAGLDARRDASAVGTGVYLVKRLDRQVAARVLVSRD
jgi:hypothetical protein